MSWQEELRVLDEELATGRISADEYRVRRDKVMSSAIAQPQQNDLGQQSEKTQYVTPVQPPQTGEGDRTQVVSGGDRTQAVTGGGWQATRPGADADRTQVVPGAGMPMGGHVPPRAMPGPPPPPPPPWGHQPQQEDMAPPWAGSEFPPLAPGRPDWIKQGPEVFDNEGGGKGKVIALVVVALLVLGGLGVGAYFMFIKDGSPAAGPSGTTTPPTTTTPPPPPDPLPLGTLPGKVTINRAVETFADMPGQRYLTEGEITAYTAGKASDTKLVICDLGSGNRLVVMLVQMPSAAAAQKTASDLHKVQIGNGMEAQSGSPAGVLVAVREAEEGKAGRFRAHFASGDIVVRLDLSTKDTAEGQVTFNDSLAGQLEKTPADG